MLKWAQNPKYYQNTEENLISRWFVRRDMLGPYDVEIHTVMSKDWWYKVMMLAVINWLELQHYDTFAVIL